MMTPTQTFARIAACAAIALASTGVAAAPAQTVVQSTNEGLLSLPYTQGFSLTVVPLPADDTFLSDYGFSIGTNSTFSSAAVTFDLGSVFQLTDLKMTLLTGTAWSGAVPADLSAAQVADRDSRIVATSSATPTAQTIDQLVLGPGNYVVEVSGHSVGAAGGTFSGLLNIAAVPEPTGLALGLAGFGLLALARRRSAR